MRVQMRDPVRIQARDVWRACWMLYLLIFISSLVIPSTQIQADPITISLVPVSTEIQLDGPDDPLVIDIRITNPDPQRVKSWSLDLYFDPAVFDPLPGIGSVPTQGFELGDYISGVIGQWNPDYESNGISPDIARMGALNVGMETGSDPIGLLAHIALDVVGLSPGSTLSLQGQIILASGGAAPDVVFESTQVIVLEREPPAIVTAESIKEHGGEGEYGIDVLAAGHSGVECRRGGTTKAVITFDKNVQRVNGDLADVALSSGMVLTVDVFDDQVTVTMADTADAVPLVITFPGIADANDIDTIVTDTLCIRQLTGDIAGSSEVNLNDMMAVQNHMDETTGPNNFRTDIRNDGVINLFDMLDVRDNTNTLFTGSCP